MKIRRKDGFTKRGKNYEDDDSGKSALVWLHVSQQPLKRGLAGLLGFSILLREDGGNVTFPEQKTQSRYGVTLQELEIHTHKKYITFKEECVRTTDRDVPVP